MLPRAVRRTRGDPSHAERAARTATRGLAARHYTVMDATNTERGALQQIRVGLIADGERLALVGPVVQASPLLQVCVQAGMPQAAALPGVPWFDDPRRVFAATDIQAVLFATTPRAEVALATAALERGLHVWRLPPIARNFAEAAEIVRRVQRKGVIYCVASWWEQVVDHAWRDLEWPETFRPTFSEARVASPGPDPSSWRTLKSEAGGGVLAHEAYPLLEALVAVRGLPDSVTAMTTGVRVAPGAAPSETEDTALALLQYPGGGAALIRAAWSAPPSERCVAHHGHGLSALLTADEVTLVSTDGSIRDRRPIPDDLIASDLRRFVESVRAGARDRAGAMLERHLAVSALLETVYLAARTQHPESPRKLYEAQGWALPRV